MRVRSKTSGLFFRNFIRYKSSYKNRRIGRFQTILKSPQFHRSS
ncbi:hypothetical protein LEP1GSC038_3978 [Leptospira weilii str. 2006001855]|uniref:Uncharacterized protein n=1 Tax=Leptospira weilii str. 2006001855 TaxID=996804 RepID=M6FH94_9LEPT|nr:hypothetical protein LEP1GSC038_3978 [Leptospira weilii str. 2006001855]